MKPYILLALLFIVPTEESIIVLPVRKRSTSQLLNKRQESHQAVLFNDNGSEYLINIGIGTPMQNFTLSLDTGSSDLWVPSIACPIDQCPLARFDPTQSTTYLPANNNSKLPSFSFQVEYGIGSVNGTYGRDHVYLGNAHVPHQLFGLATTTRDLILITSNTTNEVSNGIFGLGHPSLTTQNKIKYEPFLFQLAKQGVIDQPIFSISMGSRLDRGWSGELMIGGTNQDKYTGSIQYAPVISNNTYWMVGGKSIQVLKRDTHQEIIYNSTFKAVRGMIIDTGTTLTYMDQALAQAIVKSVVGKTEENNVILDEVSGTFIMSCNAVQLNDPTVDYFVQFVLQNGIMISIPAKDLIIPLDDSHTLCMFGIAPWMSTGSSVKMNEKGWILIGDSVLRSTYLVFDMKKNQIGFAKASYHQKEIISNEEQQVPSSSSSSSSSTSSSSSSAAAGGHTKKLLFPYIFMTSIYFTIIWSVL